MNLECDNIIQTLFVVTFDVDISHGSPEYPTNYVCNTQCLINDLKYCIIQVDNK